MNGTKPILFLFVLGVLCPLCGCIELKGVEKRAGGDMTEKNQGGANVGFQPLPNWRLLNDSVWRIGDEDTVKLTYQYYATSTLPWLALVAGLVLLLYWSAARRARGAESVNDGLQEAIEEWLAFLGERERSMGEDLQERIRAWVAGRPGAKRFERLLSAKGYAHRERTPLRRLLDRALCRLL